MLPRRATEHCSARKDSNGIGVWMATPGHAIGGTCRMNETPTVVPLV